MPGGPASQHPEHGAGSDVVAGPESLAGVEYEQLISGLGLVLPPGRAYDEPLRLERDELLLPRGVPVLLFYYTGLRLHAIENRQGIDYRTGVGVRGEIRGQESGLVGYPDAAVLVQDRLDRLLQLLRQRHPDYAP